MDWTAYRGYEREWWCVPGARDARSLTVVVVRLDPTGSGVGSPSLTSPIVWSGQPRTPFCRHGVRPKAAAPAPTVRVLPAPPPRPVANYAHMPSVRPRTRRTPPICLCCCARTLPTQAGAGGPLLRALCAALSVLDSPRPPPSHTRLPSRLQRRTTPPGRAAHSSRCSTPPLSYALFLPPNQHYSSPGQGREIFSALALFLEGGRGRRRGDVTVATWRRRLA